MNQSRGQQRSGLRRILSTLTLVLATLSVTTARAQQDPASAVHRDLPWLPADAIRLPDKNAQAEMQRQKAKLQSYEIANTERKKQIADDVSRLVQLAAELKAETGEGGKQAATADLMRMSDTIEKLAHSVKEKMKLTVY